MIKIPYQELRKKVLELPKGTDAIEYKDGETILNENQFVEQHLKMIDSYPPKPDLTHREKTFRLRVVARFYDRLLAYYIFKTQFIGAS